MRFTSVQTRTCYHAAISHKTALRCRPAERCSGHQARRTSTLARAESNDDSLDSVRDQLNRMMEETTTTSLSGMELRKLVEDKFGAAYEVRLLQRSGRTYMHVMWRHLGQQSFPLTEEEYEMQLEAVAGLCAEWGTSDLVRNGILSAKGRPGYTKGGSTGIPVQIFLGTGLSMLGPGR